MCQSIIYRSALLFAAKKLRSINLFNLQHRLQFFGFLLHKKLALLESFLTVAGIANDVGLQLLECRCMYVIYMYCCCVRRVIH